MNTNVMFKRLATLVLLALPIIPAKATVFLGKALDFPGEDDFSLLFTPQEQQQIRQAYQKVYTRQDEPIHQATYLHLNAILYMDESYWTIWVNGQKITPDSPSTHLTIHEVSATHIRCTWQHMTRNYEVELRANQTFVPKASTPDS